MAQNHSNQHLELLGKVVHLVEHVRCSDRVQDVSRTGRVIAVVVPLPDSLASASLLLEEQGGHEYYDLDDCTVMAVTS